MGGKTGSNYGALWYFGKQYSAIRLSYQFFNGEISEDQVIRHTCDNPCCINPKHLILGSQSDNILDALKRDRLPNHTLNEEAVKVIRWMLKHNNYYGLSKN